MKKIIALILTVLMVASMVPAMALVSSAEATTLTTVSNLYGTGAETWKDGSRDRFVTQFLIGYNTADNGGKTFQSILDEVGYTDGKWDTAAGKWGTPATCTKGRFDLTVTDLSKKVTVFKNITPGTVYKGGASNLFRMEVNDATPEGGKDFTIEVGNVYTLKLDIYVGDTLTYTSTATGYKFKTGTNEETNKIYKAGKAIEPTPTFVYDAYGSPVTVPGADWKHFPFSDGAWFESHQSFGIYLCAGFAKTYIPEDSTVNLAKCRAKVAYSNGLVEDHALVATGATLDHTVDNVECTLFRIKFDQMPKAGEYANTKVTVYLPAAENGGEDKTLFVTGGDGFTIKSPGNGGENEYDPLAVVVTNNSKIVLTADKETVPAGDTFTVKMDIKDLPSVGVNGWSVKLGYDKTLVEPVSFEAGKAGTTAILGGMNVTNGEVYGVIPGADGTGVVNYTENFTAGTITFRALADAKVGETAQITGEVTEYFYATADAPYEIDLEGTTVTGTSVKIDKAAYVLGDVNNDGKVNGTDRNALARHLANWKGYEEATINMLAADVNGDGKVNGTDRNALARHLANWKGYEDLPVAK